METGETTKHAVRHLRQTVKTPGRYDDGRGGLGLSLLVRTAARGHVTKCWTQSVRIDRRPTSIGLGHIPS